MHLSAHFMDDRTKAEGPGHRPGAAKEEVRESGFEPGSKSRSPAAHNPTSPCLVTFWLALESQSQTCRAGI